MNREMSIRKNIEKKKKFIKLPEMCQYQMIQ